MKRREFVKFVAAMCAGMNARDKQLDAFERYYEANSEDADDLIAVDEIWLSGLANESMPLAVDIYNLYELKLSLGLNAFGGVIRWCAAPDQKILTSAKNLSWKIEPVKVKKKEFSAVLTGHILYIDSDGVRTCKPVTTYAGHLGSEFNV